MARSAARRAASPVEPVRPLHEIWADLKRCEAEVRDSMARLAETLGSLLLPPDQRPAATPARADDEAPATEAPPAPLPSESRIVAPLRGQAAFDFAAPPPPVEDICAATARRVEAGELTIDEGAAVVLGYPKDARLLFCVADGKLEVVRGEGDGAPPTNPVDAVMVEAGQRIAAGEITEGEGKALVMAALRCRDTPHHETSRRITKGQTDDMARSAAVTTTRAAKKLSREALLVLDAVIVEGNIARIPPATAPALRDLAPGFKNGERLERKLYEEVNEALVALGGKWKAGRTQGHVFDGDPSKAIGAVVETGEFVDAKKLYQFFETPAPLADRLVELAAIDEFESTRVLEPSCGRLAIVRALQRWGHPEDALVLVEKNPAMAAAASKELEAMGALVHEGDFLDFTTTEPFDRVVMNPPFAGQQDIDHARHAFGMLRPGGRLVSVMGAGVLFRENAKAVDFREWCGMRPAVVRQLESSDVAGWGVVGGSIASGVCSGHVEKLPAGTFAASGTGVSSIVLVLDKAA